METKLAENIRTFRKERALTQEQLAEVLGVTVGAVYKWEAKLSQPELTMIMTMADFFDTSVDVLLGYEMKDNRLQSTVDRLKKYYHDKDREGLREAEKALKKYPNDFNVVYSSATLYRLFGFEGREKALLRRSLEPLPCGGKAADIFTLSSLYPLPCFNVRCGKAEICFGAAQPPLTGYELFTPVTRGAEREEKPKTRV